MKVEVKSGITFLYADPQMRIKHKNKDKLYGSLALAKSDSPDNYEEVDELWGTDIESAPEIEEPLNINPDENGKISYSDAQKLVDTITILRKRTIDLQVENHDLSDRLSAVEKLLKEGSK